VNFPYAHVLHEDQCKVNFPVRQGEGSTSFSGELPGTLLRFWLLKSSKAE